MSLSIIKIFAYEHQIVKLLVNLTCDIVLLLDSSGVCVSRPKNHFDAQFKGLRI